MYKDTHGYYPKTYHKAHISPRKILLRARKKLRRDEKLSRMYTPFPAFIAVNTTQGAY